MKKMIHKDMTLYIAVLIYPNNSKDKSKILVLSHYTLCNTVGRNSIKHILDNVGNNH